MSKTCLTIIALVAVTFISVSATIINIPTDYLTIQGGINASFDGDTVLVQPGTYIENINFNGHNIALGSQFLTTWDTSYITATIIDADSAGGVIIFENGEDSTAILSGFTILNGFASYGGGIYCVNSSPTIDHNYILKNHTNSPIGLGVAGGIYCEYSNSIISNNIIASNSSTGYAGGIYIGFSNIRLFNNIIVDNTTEFVGAGVVCWESDAAIVNCQFSYNYVNWYAGGIYFYRANASITSSLIYENDADSIGGICLEENSIVRIMNSIIWSNQSQEISTDLSSFPLAVYNDIEGGWTGTGNINTDPLFRDPGDGDLHLMAITCGDPYDSPCIDAGHPDLPDSILDCTWGLGTLRSDIGAYAGGDTITFGGQVHYVPDDFLTIQEAINHSYNGDTVLVRPGIYYENLIFRGFSIVLSSLLLTTGDTSYISQTIIDGDQLGRVIEITIDEDSSTVLMGFTIQNGLINGDGAGIHCRAPQAKISNNIIQYNEASGSYGGGIYCGSGIGTIISENIITNNIAYKGGGVFSSNNQGNNIIISNNYICNNSASGAGGGIDASGLIISNNTICFNTAVSKGGGVNNYRCSTMTNNVINNNSAESGGGIYSGQSSEIYSNTISYNTAINGGGVYVYGSDLIVRGNTILGNNASSAAGGMYFSDCIGLFAAYNIVIENSANNGGGIYWTDNSHGKLTNNVIYANIADSSGGALYCTEDFYPIITNTIIWSNSAPSITSDSTSLALIRYCDVQGGWPDEGNIDVDPMFRDADNGDYHLMALECGDLFNSPCIDAGSPAINDSLSNCDWGLATRLSDIGAYGGGENIAVPPGIINVPNDYSTIQAAINFSQDHDTILVQPGTYTENVNFNGHRVVLGSLFITTGDTSYISSTIIDGDSSGSVIILENNEDSTTCVLGFTIQNGYASYGGGIYCKQTNPLITKNIISNNNSTYGGGINCNSCYSVKISGNSIINNSAYIGGGIKLDGGGVIDNNHIDDNSAGESGGGLFINGSIDILNNIIRRNTVENYGGGVYLIYGGMFCNNTISYNFADERAGGMCCYETNSIFANNIFYSNVANTDYGGLLLVYSNPIIRNSIFWANFDNGSADDIYINSSSPVITYCDIQSGWTGEGNISIDPLFRDPANGDFHLMSNACGDSYDSPCIDIGHPLYRDSSLSCLWGLGGNRSDMGAHGGGKQIIGYEYLPGDVNMSTGAWPPSATGPDVTYLVNYFRSLPTSVACPLDGLWCSADANGDCNVIGSDVTKLVNVFRGIGSIGYCADYEPAWLTPADLPAEAPAVWPNCE